MAKDQTPLDAIEQHLDDWTAELGTRARTLVQRLADHRKRLDARGRREGGYRPLLLTAIVRGNSLEIRWQKATKTGPWGQKPKAGLWLTPLAKMAKREGNGYHYETLSALAPEVERELVCELEREAREIRREHADNMTIRRGLTTVRLRERARKDGKNA